MIIIIAISSLFGAGILARQALTFWWKAVIAHEEGKRFYVSLGWLIISSLMLSMAIMDLAMAGFALQHG